MPNNTVVVVTGLKTTTLTETNKGTRRFELAAAATQLNIQSYMAEMPPQFNSLNPPFDIYRIF